VLEQARKQEGATQQHGTHGIRNGNVRNEGTIKRQKENFMEHESRRSVERTASKSDSLSMIG